MLCSYCKKDPGTKGNGVVWKGFKDGDTGAIVCFGCRFNHYHKKSKDANLRNLYSELPVIDVQPQLQLQFQSHGNS